MKILVADDHQLIVDDILDELSDIVPEAQCIGTNDPSAILGLVDKHHFDVIFMDIDLDYTNGIDLADQILAKYPHANIIYVTSYPEYALDSYRTKASTFLMKPVGTEMLKDALQNLRYPVPDIKDKDIAEMSQSGVQLGLKIHRIREERGITANQLAEKLGCALQTVYRWESGTRMPDIPTLMKIAQILGVSLDELTR
ncbi:MAG: helix-turn-helix domain-containing protein [Clostridia bacterium]|nr:helix-turn-helix domain-containing protein [Clostridia bacterium]